MKFLTPEIEALAKEDSKKSLVKPGVSCGIFQDTENKNGRQKYYYEEKIEKGLK
ncbi:hypothetical protein [Neotamlana nanhaiensis]|uniref:hypothetical protein n=1 Tax=Neotamlana nanhaiensis TaxID=1382798 RepID=UPI000B3093C9|nr:hypothetical protein [Tamlana nanhaiensis]